MHGGDYLAGGRGKDNGQTVSGLHGEGWSPLPTAGIDDDAIGVDGAPLPRRRLDQCLARAGQGWSAVDGNNEFHSRRMGLIHPDDVAPQDLCQIATTLTHEGLLITDVQSNVAA